MALFTRLDDRDAAAIAARFAIGPVTGWRPIAAGTINSNFQLDTDRGRFFLRVNEGKSEADVRYEAELIRTVAAAGVATPAPVPDVHGAPYATHRDRLVSVFPWQDGVHRGRGAITAGDTRALGAALARLHRVGLDVADRFDRPGIYTFEHICRRAADLAGSGDPVLAPALAAVDEEIAWQRDRAELSRAATHGVIHGDLFPDNVLFDGPRLGALLDFEQASTGSLAYDLAVCLNAWCYDPTPGRPADFDPALIAALVAGYQGVRPLAAADVAALPVAVRAAAMRFTVTRITDVHLPGLDAPSKDFRRYLARLHRWREVGAKGLLSWAQLGE